MSQRVDGAPGSPKPTLRCHCTYIPMELGEGVDHIKPVHVNDSGVDNQLRAGCAVKAQHVRDFTVNKTLFPAAEPVLASS